jgi:phospholipase/lecithinase/hemolysin
MNQIAKVISGAAFALTTLCALPASAANLDFQGIYSFGDSLTDPGNFFAASGGTFPPAPYSDGRFSNGQVWVEYLAEDLELNPARFTSLPPNSEIPDDGINFAFGGATSGSANIAPGFPGVEQQVDGFLNLLGGQSADDDALYTLWAGANDYFNLFASPPSFSDVVLQPFRTVNNLSESITKLAQAGAEDILVFNLPDLGRTPLGASDPTSSFTFNLLTRAHNFLLDRRIARLQRKLPNTNLVLFDVNDLFNDILVDPNGFGLENVTTPCNNSNFYANPPVVSPEVCQNPEQTLFWDSVHPTTVGHEIIADSVYETLESAFGSQKETVAWEFASQSLARSALAVESDPVTTVPEPATVPAIALGGLWLLVQISRKRSNS